eukprot:TRINITY_DN48193_c0_g1_i1.p1 TRINITY_DN48193_c0_g1~~TRINITY_DN48193_c0_g1_i1.p1  ORF type:complete len:143 (-),score=29.70 TRINITY_DN48193_c0_g1_i1:907-1335(-)
MELISNTATFRPTVEDESDNEDEIYTEQLIDDDQLSTMPGSNSSNMMLLHCLFAMVFAAATLGLLSQLGFVVRTQSCCPAGRGYSVCEVWQDARSMMSFLLGAVLCCLLTRDSKSVEESTNPGNAESAPGRSGKVHLYTCLL